MKTAATLALDLVQIVESGDHRVMRQVSRWRAPRWIRIWMIAATRGGDGGLWYVLGAFILAFGGPSRLVAIFTALAAEGAGSSLFLWLKKRIGRKRPCMIEPVSWHALLPPDQFSFPSGHTITAFAIALTLSHFYPALFLGLCFCAGSVAISRVLLGMHFVSDVIAGAILGSSLAWAAVTTAVWLTSH